LETLAWEQPFHERFQVLLMRALHASGRTAEALEVYTRARTTLQEELGLDPGEELQEEHVRVLAGRPPPGAVRDDVASPAQLPSSPAGLIGREPELAEIDEVMGSGDTRICVVTGTAGVGKTAAALAWAHRRRTDFPDGQLFVDLRGFSDERPTEPIEALAAFLRSLGIDDEGMPPGLAERSALFRSLVAERRVLVLL
ncbi:MAG: SARP family transcriptional regulator, partial [Gemmatimonas sp.]|nr:SARP family transcriptional regulator [Gemmatimonas sp.]